MFQRDRDAEQEALNEQSERLREENAARLALPCWECGSVDGMQHYSREGVEYVLVTWREEYVPHVWYAIHGDDHFSYIPCKTCNQLGRVPGDYIPIENLDHWLCTPCPCSDCKLLAAY